jgi:hypothetical protein
MYTTMRIFLINLRPMRRHIKYKNHHDWKDTQKSGARHLSSKNLIFFSIFYGVKPLLFTFSLEEDRMKILGSGFGFLTGLIFDMIHLMGLSISCTYNILIIQKKRCSIIINYTWVDSLIKICHKTNSKLDTGVVNSRNKKLSLP